MKYKVKITNHIFGVPTQFFHHHDQRRFKIIGATESEGTGFAVGIWYTDSSVKQPLIAGTRIYKRIFIKFR